MKIRKHFFKNIVIQYILGLITSIYIYLVKYTSKIHYENRIVPEQFWEKGDPFILAFWHSQLMMVSFSWSIDDKINILASGHSDGRFGAIVGRFFNLNNIPTSNNKQKLSLRPIFKLLKEKQYVGITPDGPRGPKEKVSEGIIKIAKKSNVPIVPLGFWSSKNLKLKSWDSFLVTLPFSTCSFVWDEPLIIPNNITDEKIEYFQNILQKKINISIQKAKNNCK